MNGDQAALIEAAEQHAMAVFPLRRFSRFTEIERYVDSVVTGRWWSERFPDAPLEVVVQRRSRSATFSAAARHPPSLPSQGTAPGDTGSDHAGLIWLVDGHGWGLETVLHELAHLAAGTDAAHGARFAEVLGELWRHEAGFQAWAAFERGLALAAVNR